jgi:hypothetical protein
VSWSHSSEKQPTKERVARFYERLDGYLGSLVDAAGNDCWIVLASDHGFGPAASRRVNMHALAGALGLGGGPTASSRLRRFGITKRRIYKYLGALVPERRLRQVERAARDRQLSGINGKLVKLHDYIGGVWIHSRSRGGPVADSAVPEFRNHLITGLMSVIDQGVGAPFVTEAVPREAVFRGGRVANAPDVVFFLDTRYGLDANPQEDRLIYNWTPPNTGTHREDGILLVAGPHASRGSLATVPRIEDVAPTILHLLGLPVPSAMDGRVLTEALAPEYVRTRPLRTSETEFAAGDEVGAWDSESEQEEIMERLRGIGYVE